MNPEQALPILKALADGINPTTGEAYPEDSLYCEPRVVRALFTAVDIVQREVDKNRRKERQPANFGKPWDEIEEQFLRNGYGAGRKPIPELAAALQRSQSSIRLKLEKMGMISRATP